MNKGIEWDKTVSSRCRYGDIAGRIVKDSLVLWEDSEENYQGHVNLVARSSAGDFMHLHYEYGSCSVCDEWEDRGLSDDEIEEDMRKYHCEFFPGGRNFYEYVSFVKAIPDSVAYGIY